MTDDAAFRKLLAVLRLGGSDQPHEADAALRKGVEMMKARGVTMAGFLERFNPNDLPQGVCAELARRYYDARDDLSVSDRQKEYQIAFARIAKKYLPEEFRPHEESPRKPEEPQKNPEPERGSGPDPDWVQSMERRRREEEERRRNAAGRGRNGDTGPTERRAKPTKARSPWRLHSIIPRFLIPDIHNGFLSRAVRAPIKTIHLFCVSLVASIIPGILASIVIAWLLRYFDIYIFDQLDWETVLSVSMFPLMIRKGRKLYRLGWFSNRCQACASHFVFQSCPCGGGRPAGAPPKPA